MSYTNTEERLFKPLNDRNRKAEDPINCAIAKDGRVAMLISENAGNLLGPVEHR